MPEKRVSDVFRIRNRFLRSAHLERDFSDPASCSGYILTDFIQSCLRRVAHGLKPNSGQRAWRMTGDFGSGKSSFALVLAHLFTDNASRLPKDLRAHTSALRIASARPRFVPVLVTCSRQSLGTSILKALHQALSHTLGRGSRSSQAIQIQRLLEQQEPLTDDQVFNAIVDANRRIIADSKGNGLLLILDELGKFLEFAALHSDRQDVFLLQRLAESAARSGKEALFVVCLLHQGFNAYSDLLSQSAQREWEKIAGRFEEIIFDQPIEQFAQMIAAALNVNTAAIARERLGDLNADMARTIQLRWFGPMPGSSLSNAGPKLYPLHPTVLPVLIRTFRRFAQNERSLFSFLLSNEPFGLQAFSERRMGEDDRYCLHHFYDYVRANFGHRLSSQSYRSHWNLIDSVVESFATEDECELKVLKTVGILNLLDDGDLVPTETALMCALESHDAAQQKAVRVALAKLHKGKRILYDRGRARGLCLWPHTSIDLEAAYDKACRSIDPPQRVAESIGEYLETRPIVARRHYIETGNLRHWEVRYCSVSHLDDVLAKQADDADGLIVVPLCETTVERNIALERVQTENLRQRSDLLIAVPQPLNSLAALLQEVQRWDWISTGILELNADKYAREEVSRQRTAARAQLEKRIQNFIGWKQLSGQVTLDWFYQGRALNLTNGRHLLERLSEIFDDVFSLAPCIHNELVNRRNLSSAAAAARMRLIERMFTHFDKDLLGMDGDKKPPEMSMYLSVLRLPGLHHKREDTWRLGKPRRQADTSRILPTFERIAQIVERQPDTRVNVAELFKELRKPPYGVRDGVIPLLLTVFAIAHDKDVAFYKDGSFVREMTGESLLVLTKAPERFDIQFCKIEGVRAELFRKLLALLEVKSPSQRDVQLLDVVKELCVFVARLPAFVLHTKRLNSSAMSVRDAILGAREPARLLFLDLPQACGFDSIRSDSTANNAIQAFVKVLKQSLDELRNAYPALQDRIRKQLQDAFHLQKSSRESRQAIAIRSERVLLTVTEPKLRAFCLRLMDSALAESDWLESIASFLALKPPSKWHDVEEDLFNTEIAEVATRFHRVESILFSHWEQSGTAVAVRLSITQANGMEHERVVHYGFDEEQTLRELEAQFGALLAKDRRLGLAAASRAIWVDLEKGGLKEG
jgi:hypothetical protein